MKKEVRALEQAVCGLVAKLDILLTAEFGLRLFEAGNGLHIQVPDHLSAHRDDAFVTIYPVGWRKDSRIQARFFHTSKGWELYEGGVIWAPCHEIPISGLCFKPSDEGLGIRLDPTGESQHQLIANGYAQLIASLQKDAAAHLEKV